MSGINKIVLAYSGGLDTSAIIPWLKEHYDAEIIAFVADVGQERDDLEGIEQKAIASGATKCIIKDLREEFVKEYVYPTLKTGAVYEGTYLLGTSMARPVIAKAMVEAALAEVPTPSPTVAPARATTRCVSKGPWPPWRPS